MAATQWVCPVVDSIRIESFLSIDRYRITNTVSKSHNKLENRETFRLGISMS